jgi:hypothetical protein
VSQRPPSLLSDVCCAVQPCAAEAQPRLPTYTNTRTRTPTHTHTQVQTNWQLPCAGAVVTEAKLGRFTSSPTGPCVDQGLPSAWAVCPEALDLTDQVRRIADGLCFLFCWVQNT